MHSSRLEECPSNIFFILFLENVLYEVEKLPYAEFIGAKQLMERSCILTELYLN